MKRMLLVIGLMVCLQGPAHANVFDDIVGGVGSVVSTTVSVTHRVIHVVQDVAGVGMTIIHTALDVLNIPFADRAE